MKTKQTNQNSGVLEYDKTIWQVFAVGVVASVVILYYVTYGKVENYEIWALILGFSILIYSFFLTLGYGAKKEGIDNLLSNKLNKMWYPRTRWMGEIILVLIGVYYFIVFDRNWYLPTIILLIAILLSCIANCCSKCKEEKKSKLGFCDYIQNYFCIKKIKLEDKNENQTNK